MVLQLNPYTIPGLPSQHTVISHIAKSLGITVDEMMGRERKGDALIGRQVAQYILRNHYNMSLPEIGRLFNVTHASVYSNCQKVRYDIEFARTYHPKQDSRVYKVVKIVGEI